LLAKEGYYCKLYKLQYLAVAAGETG